MRSINKRIFINFLESEITEREPFAYFFRQEFVGQIKTVKTDKVCGLFFLENNEDKSIGNKFLKKP